MHVQVKDQTVRLGLTILILLLMSQELSAQDRIITTSNDTINCRISRVDSSNYYFTIMHGNDIRNSLIPVTEVSEVERGTVAMGPTIQSQVLEPGYHKLLLQTSGGPGYRTAEIADDLTSDLREYIEELMRGYTWSSSAHYYISKDLGLGVSHAVFFAENQIQSIGVSDKINIQFIGPSVQSRMDNFGGRFVVTSSMSLGYLSYTDKARVGESMLIEGETLGALFNLDLMVPLSGVMGVLLGVSYLQGTLSEITLTTDGHPETIDLGKENGEGLGRFDLRVGVHWSN
ncbi:MAG: hypothetical protein K9M49_02170 [Candidatus Marinimicrobia bacterium]|nr:hypothetical protein [Candidatus Neomarinimicrobiota bacterium]MCF7903937.1 hypothetical protein [Candidatus Neomarinimicrobiota bacterium]